VTVHATHPGIHEPSRFDAFWHDGVIFPIPVLSREETARYRRACDRLEESLGGNPKTVEVRQMHLHFPWAYDLATSPRVLDAVETVLGPNLLIWATELFAKRPRDPNVGIAWHRDQDYMGFDSKRVVTAWIALSRCNEANGCVMAIRGPGRAGVGAPGVSRLARRAEAGRLDGMATRVVLEAGEMSLHDSEILHGSRPNLSDEKRVGFAIRFVDPAARPRHGRPEGVLARGRDEHGHFDLRGCPGIQSPEAALRGLRLSAVRHLDAILENLADVGKTSAGANY
jgi:hypothetical protein